MGRRLLLIGSIGLGAAALLVALAHTPPARARLLASAIARLRADYGVALQADGLDYNLSTLDIRLRNVRASAIGHEDAPFLELDALRVKLPWAVLRGRLEVESVEAVRPRLHILRAADGSLNLPVSKNPSGAGATQRINAGRVTIQDLDVEYHDAASGLSLDARGLSIALAPDGRGSIAGALTTASGPQVRLGALTTSASRFDGRLSYDGESLSVGQLDLVASELRVRLAGKIGSLWTMPTIEATYDGAVNLEGMSPWVAVEPAAHGTVNVSGQLTGPLGDPATSVMVSGDDIAWRTVHGARVRARATLSSASAIVESISMDSDAGSLQGSGRVSFAASPEGDARLAWHDIDADNSIRSLYPEIPLRLAARFAGTLDAAWRGPSLQAAVINIKNVTSPLSGSTRGLSLAGNLTLEAGGGRWRASHDHRAGGGLRIAGQSGGVVKTDALASTLDGAATVTVNDLESVTARFAAAGIRLPAGLGEVMGTARADLQLSGTWAAPRFEGAVEGSDLHAAGMGPAQVSSVLAVGLRRASVSALDVSMGGNVLRATGAIDFDQNILSGDFNAELRDLTKLTASVPVRWRPSGAMAVSGRLGGTIDHPRMDGDVHGGPIVIAEQQIDVLNAAVHFFDGTVTVDRLSLTAGEGQLTLSGRYGLETGQYTASASGQGLALRPLETGAQPGPSIDGINLEFAGEGSLDRPGGKGRLTFGRLSWAGIDTGPVDADIALSPDSASIRAQASDLKTTLTASVEPRAPWRFTIAADARDSALLQILAKIPGVLDDASTLTGSVSARANVSGTLEPLFVASADLDVDKLAARIGDSDIAFTRPAHLRYAEHELVADGLEVRIGDTTTIGASGRLTETDRSGQLRATLAGNLSDLMPIARQFGGPVDLQVSGQVNGTLVAIGSFDRPDISGDLSVTAGEIQPRDMPPALGLALQATYANGVINVDRFGGSWRDAVVEGTGSMPVRLLEAWIPQPYLDTLPAAPRTARVHARIDPITPAVLEPFVGADALAQIEGHLSASLDLETAALELDQVTGTLVLDRMDLALAGQPLTQVRPTRVSLAAAHVKVVDWLWGGAGSQLAIQGQAALGGEHELDLRLSGTTDLRMLGAFVPASTAGRAELNVRVQGPVKAPAIDGRVAIHDGEFGSSELGLAITGMTGDIVMVSDRVTARGIQASANGGTLRIDGAARLSGLALTDGAISVTARSVALNIPSGLQSEMDADLKLALPGSVPEVSGQVRILRSAYREPMSLAAQLAAATRTSTVATGQGVSLIDSTRLDISIVTVDDLAVDNNYARLDMSGDLQLVGTIGRPSLIGRTAVREGGTIYLGGHVYGIDRGGIEFANPAVIEPDLDFSSRTRIGAYDITLTLRGTPERLEAQLTSDPPLGQSDVVSLLVTGRTLDQGGAQVDVARDQLLSYLSGEFLGFAARAVGLDTMRIEQGLAGEVYRTQPAVLATEADPASRLTLSKYLRSNVELTLSQSLRDAAGLTWIISYHPRSNLELRGISRDNRDRAYELSQDFTLGAVARQSPARENVPRAVVPPVAAIRMTGSPGFSEQELRDLLKLSAGDRFDFYVWQADRERLARYYHAHGYREVRISARRVEENEASVLVYDITRGPRTSVVVEGDTLPDDLRRTLEDAWGRAVFDRFLLDEIRLRVREFLARRGYLHATVGVEIALDNPEEKRILIRIDRGVPTRERRIVFQGNERVSSMRLEQLVKEQDLEITAWLDPAKLSGAIVDFYRTLGMSGTTVTAAVPAVEGAAATLTVVIAEGPQFLVSDVTVSGAHARLEADVKTASGLKAGDPFTPATVDVARQKVEASYRVLGFNAVRVAATSALDGNAGTATVKLDVEEGSQQVLSDVVITGAVRTRPSVIDRIVAVKTSEPVNLADWYRVRRRLYETGAFRRVDLAIEPVTPAAGVAAPIEPVQARLTLEEWPPWRVRYGFQLDDERAPAAEGRQLTAGLVGDLQNRNLFGLAATGGISLRYNRDQSLARSFVTIPTFVGLPITSSVFVSRSREEARSESFLTFITDRSAVTAEQRFRLAGRVETSYSYRFERNHTFDPNLDPDDPRRLDLKAKVARLSGTALVDTRDDPFDSHRGWFHSSTLEYAAEALGSDLRFAKYLLQQYYFRPIGDRVVLASAIRLGLGRGFGQTLIPSERFLAGGGNTVRGYADNSLGGVDFLGFPNGGSALFVLNQEARIPLYRWVRGVGFLDAGNVFSSVSELSLPGLKVSLGLGLRIATPFALLRADFGAPLARTQGERRGRWFFSIGQMF